MIKAIKTLVLAVTVLLAVSCAPPKRSNTGRGFVRNVWLQRCFSVTFERQDGALFVYDFQNQPAVWTGMDATIDYEYDSYAPYCPYTAGSVTRWVK
jgi:hypothetical protein